MFLGTGKGELENLRSILGTIPELQYICLDVANGYSEHFVEFVKLVRKEFPKHTIMAGNVVTGEMVEELILSGADIIKVCLNCIVVGLCYLSLLSGGNRPGLCLHYSHKDGGGVPAAQRCAGMCGRCSRARGTHNIGRGLRVPRRRG